MARHLKWLWDKKGWAKDWKIVRGEICTALQMILDRKWSPNWTANDPKPQMIPELDRKLSRGKTRNVMEFDSCIFFALKFIHFHKLNDEWDKQEMIFWRRELWCDKFILFSLDNSSEKLLEKIKARKQQYHFPTSSIYNNKSLMLPKLRHKNLS